MSKLNWEKDPMAQIVRHQRKRQTEKEHLKRKAARLRKLEKELQAPYQSGVEIGEQRERERIKQEIMSRVTDLKSCGKNDNCEEIAQLLLDWMPEWLGEEK